LAEVEYTYYKPDEISEIKKFIEEYNPEKDFKRICFSWNGKNGEDFFDSSQDFRDKVSIYICLNNIKTPPLLLKDLIQEIGKASIEAWGAPDYLFLLSERLLQLTGGTYIKTFGETLFSNMDTYGACISMDFTGIDVIGILDQLNGNQDKDKLTLDLIEYFKSKL
jgi:hypothetical protein